MLEPSLWTRRFRHGLQPCSGQGGLNQQEVELTVDMNTKRLITTFILVLFIFGVWFRHSLQLCSGQGGLSQLRVKDIAPAITIAPSIFDLDVAREQALTEEILLKNDSDFAMPVKVEVNDYTVDEEGVPDYSEDISDWSPKTWIEVDPSDLILDKFEQRKVTLTITIPEYAQSGSHFATVLFKPVLPPEYFTEDSAHIVPYIGAVVALNVIGEDLEEREGYLEVKEFRKEETKEEEEEFFSEISNDDVYFHKVSGIIIIRNIFNKEVAVQTIDSITLFPQKTRSLINTLDKELSFGRYKADLQVKDEKERVQRSLVFWESPTLWELIWIILRIVLFLLMTCIIVLLIKKRRNIRKAIGVLVAKK